MANKLTALIVVTCGLGALGTGLYCHRQVLESQQALLAASRDVTRLEASLRRMPDQQAEVDARMAALKQADTDRRTPAAAAAAADGLRRPAVSDEQAAYLKLLAENLEMREAFTRMTGAAFAIHYAALFKAMGLSDAQISQLTELVSKTNLAAMDARQAAIAAGLDPNSAAAQAQMRQLGESIRAAATAIIGQDGMQQSPEYNRTYGAQDLANSGWRRAPRLAPTRSPPARPTSSPGF